MRLLNADKKVWKLILKYIFVHLYTFAVIYDEQYNKINAQFTQSSGNQLKTTGGQLLTILTGFIR